MGAGAGAAELQPVTKVPMMRNRFEDRRQHQQVPPAIVISRSTSSHASRPWVVWLSLDPRKSQLDLYPQDIALQLEKALQVGSEILDLGSSFYGAAVTLKRPMQQLSRKGGSRDVMRLESSHRNDDTNVSLQVIQTERGWRLAPSAHARNSEERSVRVPQHLFIPVSLDPTEIITVSGMSYQPKDGTNESQPSDAETAEGMEPLWEWCRWDGITVDMLGDLPEDAWGVYSQDQNQAIESAHASGNPSIEIEIGIRKYSLIFGPRRNLARQEDAMLRKRRLVRRRLVPEGEHAKLVKSITEATSLAGNRNLEQDECAICCGEFADTATMPVVELPGCGHIFHRACVQHEADDKKPCPVCRADVDWKAVLRVDWKS